jgi:hypothetical protein
MSMPRHDWSDSRPQNESVELKNYVHPLGDLTDGAQADISFPQTTLSQDLLQISPIDSCIFRERSQAFACDGTFHLQLVM